MVRFKYFVLTILASLIFNLVSGQHQLLDKWYTSDKDAQIKFYKKGDKYYGKIVWLSEPDNENGNPKKDVENPDPDKRSRAIMGLELFKDFEYEGDNEWEDGTVYDVESGDTYDCLMWLEDKNTLKVKGYIGVSWLGRTETFTRVQD